MLALGVFASPTPPAGKDACGPTVQVAGDPKDSCAGKPDVVTVPSSFGILGIQDTIDPTQNIHPGGFLGTYGANYKRSCEALIPETCAMMNNTLQPKDSWHVKQYADDSGFDRYWCQLAFWLPARLDAARLPWAEQCSSTFQTMIDQTQKAETWFAATINLEKYPAPEITNTGVPLDYLNRMNYGYVLPGGSGTGKHLPCMIPAATSSNEFCRPGSKLGVS